MTNIAYHTVISNSLAPEIIRQAMVKRYYLVDCNASAVAREYVTKRQTVTKWVNRFEKDGILGLKTVHAVHTPNQYTRNPRMLKT